MRLVPVQVLRAAAALMVVVHHARHEAGMMAARGAGAALDPATPLPWWAGVDLFFVISGFVIVEASATLFRVPGGRRRFLAHRVARVVPLYWLATGLYLSLALARPGLLGEAGALAREPGFVAASFLFWPAARSDGSVQPLYGLGWTLNYEFFFYLVFALGLSFGRRGAVAWLCGILALLVSAGVLLQRMPAPIAFWADPIVVEFAFGALLALARGAGLRLAPLPRLALAILGVLGLAMAAGILGGTEEATGFARPLLAGLPALALVSAAALGPARDASAEAALPVPVRALAILGDASYALYLIHPFALRPVREGLLRLGWAEALHPWGGIALMLAASVAAALVVHRLIEAPLTRAARALLDPGGEPKPVRAGAAPVPTGRGRL